MTRRFVPPLGVRLNDDDAERARRNHAEQIRELQGLPIANARPILDVSLADTIATPIAHGLGRPALVLVSPPRGPSTSGRIEEIRTATFDRNKVVVLKATGYGATVLVDLVVL